MSRANDNSNKEKELQDVGDEGIMYEPLLDDIHVDAKTILKIDMESRDGLQDVKQA